jgi:integrase
MWGTKLGINLGRTPVPKIAAEASPAKVRAMMDRPGLHAVGGVVGLLLQVSRGRNGQLRRSWILRVVVGAKRRDLGCGSYPSVTVGIARDRARQYREQIRQGIDPTEERRAARAALIARQVATLTFAEAAAKVATMKAREFRSRRHAAQWVATIEQHALPVIGKLPVSDVALEHVVAVLQPIWLTKTETATRLRGRVETVLAWAIASGFRTGDNPARWKGNLDAILPKPGRVAKVEHYKAIKFVDIGAFMAELRKRSSTAARCLEFAILTAARSGEARGMRWAEVDLQSRLWAVPPERTKAGREHRVPLSEAAVALLAGLERGTDSALVFAAPRGGMLGDMSLSYLLRRMEVDATVHGFRSTFRDWCSEQTTYPPELAEVALAHVKGRTEAAYWRSDLFERRRKLMNAWARYVGTVQPAAAPKVIPLKRA